MNKDRGRVRFHWEPLVRGRDDPRTGHPGHFLDHLLLLGLVANVLDNRVGECEIDVIVLKGHGARVGDHERIGSDRRFDIDAHLHVISGSDPLLHYAGVHHVGIAFMLLAHGAHEEDVLHIVTSEPGCDVCSLAVAVAHAVDEHNPADGLLESPRSRRRAVGR